MKARGLWMLLAAGLATPALANEQPGNKLGRKSDHQKQMVEAVKARMAAQFARADANGDGLLSREEAERNLPYVFANFESMDDDKDGHLSLDEISAHREVQK